MRVGNGNACCVLRFRVRDRSDPGPLPVAAAAIHHHLMRSGSVRELVTKRLTANRRMLWWIQSDWLSELNNNNNNESNEWEKRENRTQKDWKQIRIEKWNRNSSKLKLKLKCTTATTTRKTIWVKHIFGRASEMQNRNSTANIRKTRNRNRKNSPRDDGNCCCLCWCCCCTQLAIIKCNWFETWLVNGYANRLCLIVRCN